MVAAARGRRKPARKHRCAPGGALIRFEWALLRGKCSSAKGLPCNSRAWRCEALDVLNFVAGHGSGPRQHSAAVFAGRARLPARACWNPRLKASHSVGGFALSLRRAPLIAIAACLKECERRKARDDLTSLNLRAEVLSSLSVGEYLPPPLSLDRNCLGHCRAAWHHSPDGAPAAFL